MKKQDKYILAGGGLLLLFLLPMKANANNPNLMSSILTSLNTFLKTQEGFSSHPYWDYKQWSWGYGTRVPNSPAPVNGVLSKLWPQAAGLTISRDQAFKDLTAYVQNDFIELVPLLTRTITPNQWAAWLSFSYNLGRGNADNLIDNINSGDNAALELQWKKYIYSGGTINPDLVKRRAAEWALWVK